MVSTDPLLDFDKKFPNWIKSLEDELDCLLLVVLRDGRKLTGYLRTFDQYGNLVLENTCEKLVVNSYYADIHLGCMIIRGENIVLFGAIDEEKDLGMIELPLGEIFEKQREMQKEEPNDNNNKEEEKPVKISNNFSSSYLSGIDIYEE